LFPEIAVTVELEIDKPGMEGDLARCHRQGPQCDPRQGELDQPLDLLHRSDLYLGREPVAQDLGVDLGVRGQDEAGVGEQGAVAQGGDAETVLAFLDRDGDGPFLQDPARASRRATITGVKVAAKSSWR